ncbi:MAG: hypothetical protein ABIF77_17865, partial [bacterium]
FQAVAVWYFIALATLVEPAFYQRCYAARSEGTARAGIGLAILFWIGFDFLTTTAGLYARAVLPDLADPVAAFPALAQVTLAPVWQGLFVVGLLATIMSTIDSYAFISGVTIGRDIVSRWRSPLATGHEFAAEADDVSLRRIRWGLLATAGFAITLALLAGSVVRIWHDLGSVGTPVLLLPLVLSHTRVRLPGRLVLLSMVLAGGTSLIWIVAGDGEAWFGIEPIFPGLVVSLLVLALARLQPGRTTP